VLPCVLLSALRTHAEVAQRLPREAAAVLIRPHDDQPLLIPDNKPVWLLRLLGCELFRHFPPYCCPEVSFLSCRLLKGSACARRSAPESALLDSLCYPLTMVRGAPGREFCLGPARHIGSYFEVTVGAPAFGVHHPLGDSLAVEVGELLNEMMASSRMGPPGPAVRECLVSLAGAPLSAISVLRCSNARVAP
jgi:hypothetical protein